jgi:hypothetical protein
VLESRRTTGHLSEGRKMMAAKKNKKKTIRKAKKATTVVLGTRKWS